MIKIAMFHVFKYIYSVCKCLQPKAFVNSNVLYKLEYFCTKNE
eukprot:UN09929